MQLSEMDFFAIGPCTSTGIARAGSLIMLIALVCHKFLCLFLFRCVATLLEWDTSIFNPRALADDATTTFMLLSQRFSFSMLASLLEKKCENADSPKGVGVFVS